MRLVTHRTGEATTACGRVDGEEVVELPFTDVGALLASGPDWQERAARAGGRRRPLEGLDLAPVVPRPGKIFCVGLNFLSHIKETGRDIPEYPTLFAKFPSALVGPADDIVLPRISEKVDWEVELTVVVGRTVRHADEEQARAAIAGYTIHNDISARDFQRRTLQFLQGKIFDRTGPLGPALVTADELDVSDLAMECSVDGEVQQAGSTSDLLFGPVDLVRYISAICTLEPGDLIATGTPGGTGGSRRPEVYLQPGQVVRTAIEGIGELVNTCVPEAGQPYETTDGREEQL